jgi:hypothetical protein
LKTFFRKLTRFVSRISKRSSLRIETTIAIPPFVKVIVAYRYQALNDNPNPRRSRKAS